MGMGIRRGMATGPRHRARFAVALTALLASFALSAQGVQAQDLPKKPDAGGIWHAPVSAPKTASRTGKPVAGRRTAQLPKGAVPVKTATAHKPSWPTASTATASLLSPTAAPAQPFAPRASAKASGSVMPPQLPSRVSPVTSPVRAGSTPVSIEPVVGAAAKGRSYSDAAQAAQTGVAASVRVTTIGHTQAASLGADGAMFSLARADGGTGRAKVEVRLDYSSFAGAYGGGYGSRLHLVTYPACVLTTPDEPGCRTATPVADTNDPATGTLTATVSLPAATPPPAAQPASGAGTVKQASFTTATQAADTAAAGTVLAAQSSTGGSQGSYTASDPATSSGTWTQSSDGAFTYSYPVTTPPALVGEAPSVSLGYDSQAVDGETAARDAQQDDWIGDGWSYSPGYIQQSFRPCTNDGVTALKGSGDDCWDGYQLTMTYGGATNTLVPIGVQSGVANEIQAFKLGTDDGTLVQEFSGASNGVYDGAWFKITDTSGNEAFFGLNHAPSASGAVGSNSDPATNSAWGVPVYCPKSSDPCYDSAKGSASEASMGYRFNLDFELDPLGALTRYDWATETGYYNMGAGQASDGTGAITAYVRGGELTKISYGYLLANEQAGANPSAEVDFTSATRCQTSASFPAADCTASNLSASTAPNWPDVPYDLNCASGDSADTQTSTTESGTCYQVSPTFWTTNRLSTIITRVRVKGVLKNVDYYALTQVYSDTGYADPVDGATVDPKDAGSLQSDLWLQQIQHAGEDTTSGGTTLKENPVVFTGEETDNRANDDMTGGSSNEPPLYHPRIAAIQTETGSSVVVTYNAPSCAGSATPTAPDANTSLCYPVYWTDPGASTPTLEYFNKTTVHSVNVVDDVSDSPNELTTYSYSGPAWHRDDSQLTDDHYRTWDDFRGFRTVMTETGDPVDGDTQTQSTTTYAQGMDGDYKADGTQRSVTIPITVGGTTVETVTDSNQLSGTALKTDTYTKAGGSVVSSQVTEPPTVTATASLAQTAWTSQSPAPSTLSTLPAQKSYRTEQTASRDYSLLADGSWSETRSVTSYDAQARVTSVDDLGDVSVPSQETCTLTSYATPPASAPMMLAYADETIQVAGPCDTPVSSSAPALSDVRTLYDGNGTLADPGTFGTLTTTAMPSATEQLTSYSGSTPQWTVESAQSYDSYGRTVSSTDVNGNTTTTTYTESKGATGELPVEIDTSMTPPGAKTPWKTTTLLDSLRGLTTESTDVNTGVTDMTYDSLGRTTQVWSPGHTKAANATTPVEKFTYQVDPGAQPANLQGTITTPGAPSSVTTQKLREDGTYSSSVTIYDGMLRQRETQSNADTDTASTTSDRLVSDTFYDSHGWTTGSYPAYYDDTSGPTTTLSVLPSNSAQAYDVTVYDGMGRATEQQLYSDGTLQWQSATSYPGADETVAASPAGGPTTQTFTNALGQTTKTVVEDTDPAATLTPGQILPSGSDIESASSRLTMNATGDLALTALASGKQLWHSATSTAGSYAEVAANGNLEVLSPTGTVLYTTNLAAGTATGLSIGNDGSLTLHNAAGSAVWTGSAAGTATAANSSTSYTYTPGGQTHTVTDSAGNAWTATYNLLGQLATQTDPNAGKSSDDLYDSAGNLLQTTDARGQKLSYHYDWDNRLVGTYTGAYTTTPAAGTQLSSTTYDTLRKGAETLSTSYTYAAGSTTAETWTEGVTGYNAFGEPTAEFESIPSAEGWTQTSLPAGDTDTPPADHVLYETKLQYTPVTGALDYTYYGGDGGLPNETVSYAYNEQGELDGIGSSTGADYLDNAVHNGYGDTTSATYGPYGEQLTTTAQYDPVSSRLLATTDSLQNPGDLVDQVDYRYNAAGEVTAVDDWQVSSATHDLQCFSYDSLQRLTQAWTDNGTINDDPSQGSNSTNDVGGLGGCTNASPNANATPTTPTTTNVGGPAPYWQSYSYDLLGDRTGATLHDPSGKAASNTVQSIAYNGQNGTAAATDPDQATTVTTTGPGTSTAQSLGYDTAGDTQTLTTTGTGGQAGGTQTLTYDAQGNTATATTTDANGQTTDSSYYYDATGNLLQQDYGTTAGTTTKTLFLFGGAEQITQYTTNGNTAENALRCYAGPDGTTVYRDQSGNLSYQLALTGQNTGTLLVDAATDQLTRRYYDPYGNTRGTTPSAWVSPDDTKGFLNQPADPDSGLDLLGARQYDAAQGRFLSPDPMFEAGDPNQMGGYTYAADNPTTGSDPDGLMYNQDPGEGGVSNSNPPACTWNIGGCSASSSTCNDPDVCAPQSTASTSDNGGGGGGGGGGAPGGGGGAAGSAAAAQQQQYQNRENNDQQQLQAEQAAAHHHCSWYNASCQIKTHWAEIKVAALIIAIAVIAAAIVVLAPEVAAAAVAGFGEAAVGGATVETAAIAGVANGLSVAAAGAGMGTTAAALGTVAAAAGASGEALADDDGGGGGAHTACTGCGCSFAPTTPVLMADGSTKPIDDIKTGDKVQSADPGTGKTPTTTKANGKKDTGARTVQHVWINKDNDLQDVTLDTGHGHTETLHTTSNHPFYDETTHTWTPAADLHPGDRLDTTPGKTAPTVLTTRPTPGTADRWNLTVADLHTYYVLAGSTPLLVHNCLASAGEDDLAAVATNKYSRQLTEAGRALQKHSSNVTKRGQAHTDLYDFGKVTDKERSEIAEEMIHEILTSPNSTRAINPHLKDPLKYGGPTLDIKIDGGWGARWHMKNGSLAFAGFL